MSDDLKLNVDYFMADGTEGGGGEAKKKKKLSLKLMIILGVVVMLLVGGAVAWLLLGGSPGEELAEEEAPPVQEEVQAAPAFDNIYPLEPFTINIADMGGRVFKVTIALDLADPSTRWEIDRRVVQLRGAAGMILKSKTLDEIDTISGKIKLKTEIIKKLNMMLESGRIRNLYWSEFVVL